MTPTFLSLRLAALRATPILLFIAVVIIFSAMSPKFLSLENFGNIITQSSNVAIVAIGMTFVLLLPGVDLSVGAAMYVGAAIVGLYMPSLSAPMALLAMTAVGVLFGAMNAFFIVILRVTPFIATLATLFIGRGLALYLSKTAQVFAGAPVLAFGQGQFLGITLAFWLLAGVLLVAWWVQTSTPFGRNIYAIGTDPEGARKAGIPVKRVVFAVYVISGGLAAVGGFVSFSQIAADSSTFGYQKEFAVIAATVLGGTSLFGGRGSVLGSAFDAVLIQTVQNGLVLINTDPYLYPIIISGIIFLAVLLDSLRTRTLERLTRRRIRIEPSAQGLS